jgi:hypothetical protein
MALPRSKRALAVGNRHDRRVQPAGQPRQSPLHRPFVWRSIARGSGIGFAASLVLVGSITALRHGVSGFSDSGAEHAVSLLALACYVLGGYYATVETTDSAGATGAFAGIGVGLLGLGLSLAIWAVNRDGSWLIGQRGGHSAVVVTGPLIFGAVFGALGGALGKRRRLSARLDV